MNLMHYDPNQALKEIIKILEELKEIRSGKIAIIPRHTERSNHQTMTVKQNDSETMTNMSPLQNALIAP